MVCDSAMVASTVASIMMNGVCCLWQMQEEEDRRQSLRKDIRVEYERQRLLDLERWSYHHRHGVHDDYCANEDSSSITLQRRRDLISRKDEARRAIVDITDRQDVPSPLSPCSTSTVAAVYEPPSSRGWPEEEVRFTMADMKRQYFAGRRTELIKTATASTSDMSSLLDAENDSCDDEASSSFEEIVLQ